MTFTALFLVAFIVVGVTILTVYDIWALTTHGYEATMSYVILDASLNYPIIPFVVGLIIGILAGHLFAPQRLP
jgi:hypothetical protein